LIPEHALGRPKPPTRGPEIDEEDSDGHDNTSPGRGIDDGFFYDRRDVDERDIHSNGVKPRRGSIPTFPHPPPSYGGPGIVS
jgi:hypothetical protein